MWFSPLPDAAKVCAMMGTLQNKTALVTGASRGIGKAIALRLAAEGAAVLLTARDEAALNAVVAEITAAGGQAAVHAADLRIPTVAGELVTAARQRFGKIDIVVNNAGATRRGEFLELTDAEWEDGFALKFYGTVRLCRAAWTALQTTQGAVVNIAGIGGRTPGAQFAIGGSVNAALLSLTKALAELGIRDGVQVNAINPGAIRTDRLARRLETLAAEHGIEVERAAEQFVRQSGITRIGEPEDIAHLVAFVVSPAGRFLQGALLDMDGGQTRTL
jgi:NAD(P)-dependent dehydrogenase (short-subunit alcohol dehydrogenase family)